MELKPGPVVYMAASGDSTGPLADDLLAPPAEPRDPGSVNKPKLKKIKVGGSNTGTGEEKAVGEGSSALSAAPILNTPPLPPRCPPHPKSGKRKDVQEWNREFRRISKLSKNDPRRNLPTVVKPPDPYNADSAESPHDKALVREAACSVVSISSITLDGDVIMKCSGIVISWNMTNKCARILTTSTILGRCDPKPKLHVCLPNKTIIEGQLLFFNKHYQIALLEISSELDLPLQVPTFVSSPNYGQEVFVLARAEEFNLRVRHGRIKWSEDTQNLYRNYLMLLSCKAPRNGTGGLVVDHDGHVVGMSFDKGFPNCAILGISTILTCIEMWMKFSRIARPAHGLRLRTMELLEVSLQETIFLEHNITSGYIIDSVAYDCTAERLGVRYGDVIVSFNGLRDHTLPQLEDYLLSLGWDFLHNSIESSCTVDLKLEVYDLLGRTTRSITVPVKFSDGSD